jgi:hypothetical protein
MTTEQNTSPSGTQRATDATLQRSTPNEDASSQRDAAGNEIQDPDKKRLHEEAASYRKRAKELEAQLSTYKEAEEQARQAKLSETERLQQQYAKLQSEHDSYVRTMQERLVRYEVERQAVKVGIRPEAAEDAAKLIDWSKLKFGEDGTPENAEDLLKELLKNKTYLANPGATPASPAQPATPAIPAMNPGRSNIPSPGALSPGQRPKLADLLKLQ